MAQTGGLLLGQMSDFKSRVVLAKVSKAQFHFEAQPGEQMEFSCSIVNADVSGASVVGTVHRDGELLAEIDLMFGILDDKNFENVELFEPADFCRVIRCLRLFEVGVDQDGNPVQIPQHMTDAESAELNC